MATGTATRRQPTVTDETLIRQLDQLTAISAAYRDDRLGNGWFDTVRDFLNLEPASAVTPSFRPTVDIPQLQILTMSEASELVESTPKIYITENGKRNKEREEALSASWRQGMFNIQLLYAMLWAGLGGTGIVQVCADPRAYNGRGRVYLRWRDPDTIYPDPACIDEGNWYYVQVIERLWPDEILNRFPQRGSLLHPIAVSGPIKPADSTIGGLGTPGSLQLPPGPMSKGGQLIGEQPGPSDGRLDVRYTLIYDGSREVITAAAGTATKTDGMLPANFRIKFPNGRYIVDCQGIILADGDNPHPNSIFPLTRLIGFPAISGFWAVPPMRYFSSLQGLAGRMLTQVFENAVRLNNGVWFIDDASDISPDDFGGLPGEVKVYSSQGKPPELRLPKEFPSHFLKYPDYLLSLQRNLSGHSDARQGNPGAGNVGSDLFDAAVFQSQGLMRMRAQLLAPSIQRIIEQVFYMMARFVNKASYPDFSGKDIQERTWEGIQDTSRHEVWLDPGSVRPLSAMATRKLVPELRKMNLIDTRNALEMLDIPGAAEIAGDLEIEKALESLARIKRVR